jgi:hypothetical protein
MPTAGGAAVRLPLLKGPVRMETHPQKAEDMPLGDGDLSTLVRTIDPILDQLYDGAIKGALHADDLVDIATRIRTILHEAVARRDSGGGAGSSAGSYPRVDVSEGDAPAYASAAGG